MIRHILLLCLLGNPFELNLGGHQRTILEIIEHFKDIPQLKITVITTVKCSLKQLTPNYLYSNITLYEISIKKEWFENQDLLYDNRIFLYEAIKRIYENIEHPITLVHSTYWISGLLASRLCSEYHLTQIHSVISTSRERKRNGFPPVSSHQYESEQLFLPKVDCIISITESEYELLIEEYHIKPLKIIVVGRTVADCFLHPSHLPSGNLDQNLPANYNALASQNSEWWINGAFCYVGRIVDQKGIKEIILAWEILYKKYLELTPPMWFVGGTAEDICKYRRIIKKYVPDLETYEKQHKIYWWGFLSAAGISNVLLKCNVLIMHSAFEPGGRVILEAMSAGKPIISTYAGFGNNYVQDWYNGFHVEYGAFEKLSQYLELFIINPYLSNMLGINSRNFFRKISQNWDYFQRISDLYFYFGTNQYIYTGNLFYKKMQSQYPNLVDVFPYSDIKNDISDISAEFHIKETDIISIESNQSYLWKTPHNIIKQYYNRFNCKQEWNTYDSKQVIPLMSLYDATIFSSSLSGYLSIAEQSDILFSYTMPLGRVLTNDECLKEMPLLLKKARKSYTNTSYDESDLSEINSKFQLQHKYYTIQDLIKELTVAMENHSVFTTAEISCIKTIFDRITYILIRLTPKYGMNYGKSLLNHIVEYNMQTFLLPSCDIYFGETGIDEAYTYMEYYKDGILEHLNLQKCQSIDTAVLLWIVALSVEKYIAKKILYKECKIELSSILNFCDNLFETVPL